MAASSAPVDPSLGDPVVCPDGSECPSGTTCCEIASGGYGCCPFSGAVCCEDKEHCCPSGTTCDVAAGTCDRSDTGVSLPWAVKVATVKVERLGGELGVDCEDGGKCSDDQTCCKLADGSWGCCPYPTATCCRDGVHCCPFGYTCNDEKGSCDKGALASAQIVPLTELTVKKSSDQVEKSRSVGVAAKVTCPDGSQCPRATTCCQFYTGSYGCCYHRHATCCADLKHCCPEGFTCHVSTGTCSPDEQSLLAAILPLEEEDEEGDGAGEEEKGDGAGEEESSSESDEWPHQMCKGGKYCPGFEKCCYNKSGSLSGCCKFRNGVCCPDGRTCCKKGSTCNKHGGCTDLNPAENITCPCQSDTMKCCSATACCPVDYECDLENERCTQAVSRKFTALTEPGRSCESVTRCTNGLYCPHSSHCLDIFGVCVAANGKTGHLWVGEMKESC